MKQLLVISALLLAGCATPTPEPKPAPVIKFVEVPTPVYVKAQAPSELMRKFVPTHTPQFVAPSDPGAVVALTADDLDSLKILLRTLVTRDDAWRAWAMPTQSPPK